MNLTNTDQPIKSDDICLPSLRYKATVWTPTCVFFFSQTGSRWVWWSRLLAWRRSRDWLSRRRRGTWLWWRSSSGMSTAFPPWGWVQSCFSFIYFDWKSGEKTAAISASYVKSQIPKFQLSGKVSCWGQCDDLHLSFQGKTQQILGFSCFCWK